MKINGYIIAAAILIALVFLSYFLQFYVNLDYELSDDSAVWAQLGDYVGGLLNPLLSFVSIVLLIKSLSLQNEANRSLRVELKNNEKTEKLRSFEILFFNLIDSQKKLFDTFNIEFERSGQKTVLLGAQAVIKIEEEVEIIRNNGGTDTQIQDYIEELDKNDQIFGLSRAFYILVTAVFDKLSDVNGFTEEDRRAHFRTLVNFTDFSQLRLILMTIQFMDYHSTRYIRASDEFTKVINELNSGYDLY